MRTSLHCFHWPETTMRAIKLSVIFSWGILNLWRVCILVGTLTTSQRLRLRMKAIWNEVRRRLPLTCDDNILLSSKRWKLNTFRVYRSYNEWQESIRHIMSLLQGLPFQSCTIYWHPFRPSGLNLSNDNFSVVFGMLFLRVPLFPEVVLLTLQMKCPKMLSFTNLVVWSKLLNVCQEEMWCGAVP